MVLLVCSLAGLARFPLFCGGWGLGTRLPSSLSLRDDKATQDLYQEREQGDVRARVCCILRMRKEDTLGKPGRGCRME